MIKSNKPIRMDEYIPPLVAVTTGIVAISLCFFMRIPFFLIGIIAIVFVFYGIQDHLVRFAADYKNFSAPTFFKEHASNVIIAVVILLSLGFLLLKFGPKAVFKNQPTVIDNYGKNYQLTSPFSTPPSRSLSAPRSSFYNSKNNNLLSNSGKLLSDRYSLYRRV